jgi:hypothetical protein
MLWAMKAADDGEISEERESRRIWKRKFKYVARIALKYTGSLFTFLTQVLMRPYRVALFQRVAVRSGLEVKSSRKKMSSSIPDS